MTLRRFVATGLALAMAALLVSGTAMAAGKPAPTSKVNLNTASVQQLTTLPGVGPQLAARIARNLDRWSALAEPYRSAAREAISRVAAGPV